MLKFPPDPVLEEIYLALKERKLVQNTADFMREYLPMMNRAMYRKRASTRTLVRLWLSLNMHGQHDLGIRAHKALLFAAQSQHPSQGVE